MDLSVSRITNANIYINGVNLMERAEEVEIPNLKQKMVEHKGLGMAGSAEFWAGVDKLEAKIKWASIYPEAEQYLNDPFTFQQIQVRSSIDRYLSNGRSAQLPLVYLMTAAFKDGGSKMFKQHENVDSTSTLTVYHAQLIIDGVEQFLYDVMANIYSVNGVDLLAQLRANLGA
jgi:uncharacterized protein